MTGVLDQYFEWWQAWSSRYLKSIQGNPLFLKGLGIWLERTLEMKKIGDRLLVEMWRNAGLPPLEEIIRLHQRLNHLESQLFWLRQNPEEGVIFRAAERPLLSRGLNLNPRNRKKTINR